MENFVSTQILGFVRDASFTQISRTLTGTDGTLVWRGAGPIVGRYRHEVRAITSGPPPITGGGNSTTRVRYGTFG
jgi:hypothetical protein